MPPRSPKSKAGTNPYPPGWEPFLGAISDNLDDDTPRLVFADWLQENGDEARAEFIRIQCELYRVHERWENPDVRMKVFTPEQSKASERQRELRIDNHERWVGALPAWSSGSTWAFRRGFAYFFAPTARQWIKDGDHVRGLTAVEMLTLKRTEKLGKQLFNAPATVGLREFCLPDIDTEGVRALTDSPALDSLTWLMVGKIGQWGIDPNALAELVASPRLTKVRSLTISSNYAGKAVATALANSKNLGKLDELGLVCVALGPKEFGAVVASPKLKQLRRLNLQGNGIGDSGVRSLVQSKLLRLEELNLKYNGLTAKSARLLAAWPGLRSVRVLEVGGAQFGVDGVHEFLESEYLGSLEKLILPAWEIRKPQQTELATLPTCQRIPRVYFES